MILTRTSWNILFLAAVTLGVALIGASRVRPAAGSVATAPPVASQAAPAPEVGRPAPDFTLDTSDGASFSLTELRGKVVLINVWATWCPPCRAEMPAIQAAYERYAPEGFAVVALNMAEEPGVVAAYLREHGLSFPVPLDRDGQVSQAYRATVLPSSFFVDRRGVVRAVYRGPMSRGVISGTVEQLLAEGS